MVLDKFVFQEKLLKSLINIYLPCTMLILQGLKHVLGLSDLFTNFHNVINSAIDCYLLPKNTKKIVQLRNIETQKYNLQTENED